MAEAYCLRNTLITAPSGRSIPAEALRDALKQQPGTRAVFSTLCETSTGVLEDIEGYAKLTRTGDTLLIVDTVSGLAADRFEMDAWGVDVAVSGSQKGLMIPPGLAFVAASPKAAAAQKKSNLPKYYFDLALYEKALGDDDSPFTPALGLILALREALKRIMTEGYDTFLKRAAGLAEATRKGVTAMNLRLFAECPSNAVTSVVSPEGVDSKKLVKMMRDELGVTMAGGQSELAGKIFRIANMGYITAQDLEAGFQALEQALKKLGVNVPSEAGIAAFKRAAEAWR